MLKNEQIWQKYPFFRKGNKLFWSCLRYMWLHLQSSQRREDYCDFEDIEFQKRISRRVTRWLSLYRSLPRRLQLYPASNSYFMSFDKSTADLKRIFGNSLSEFCLKQQGICNLLWLLWLSKFRILRSQKHHLLRLYLVSPLWRQGFKRENQMYISSQVKLTLRKFSKAHDCDLFMYDVSALYKPCVSHLANWSTLFAEFICID